MFLCQDFIVLCLIGDIFSPNDPLWQIISDIIIERVGKCLGTSVEVLVRSTLKKRLNHHVDIVSPQIFLQLAKVCCCCRSTT